MVHNLVKAWINENGNSIIQNISKVILEDAEPICFPDYVAYDIDKNGVIELGYRISILQNMDINTPISQVETKSIEVFEKPNFIPPKEYFFKLFVESVDYAIEKYQELITGTYLQKYDTSFVRDVLLKKFSDDMDKRMGALWS